MRDVYGVEWVRPAEAAERLGIPRGTIDVWVHRGKIEKRRVRGHVALYWPDCLDAEMASRTRRQRGA